MSAARRLEAQHRRSGLCARDSKPGPTKYRTADVNYCSERNAAAPPSPPTTPASLERPTWSIRDRGSARWFRIAGTLSMMTTAIFRHRIAAVGVLDKPARPQSPLAPSRLQQDQQLGERDEIYRITFDVNGESMVYQTTDLNDFLQFQPGNGGNWKSAATSSIFGPRPRPLMNFKSLDIPVSRVYQPAAQSVDPGRYGCGDGRGVSGGQTRPDRASWPPLCRRNRVHGRRAGEGTESMGRGAQFQPSRWLSRSRVSQPAQRRGSFLVAG